jgi:DNA-binding transcriptional LysR family regulator
MLDINWNALHSSWLVSEHGSFAAAARAAPHGTAQASFKRVKQLEDSHNLNLKLFRSHGSKRSHGAKGVELTEAGLKLRRFLDPVSRSLDAITSDLRGEDSGSMVVAAVPYAAYNYGNEVIRHFLAGHHGRPSDRPESRAATSDRRCRTLNRLSLVGGGGRRGEWMLLDDSLALAHDDPLVGRDGLEGFRGALGPADGNVHLGVLA